MIAVDTSALMAILFKEPVAGAVEDALVDGGRIVISATTYAEALIVARRQNHGTEMAALTTRIAFDVVPVTRAVAERAADAYDRWGKGVHPAGLNICDCFSYALAREFGCPLLYVGDDFAKTDVTGAIAQ